MDIKILNQLQALSPVEIQQQKNHIISDDIPTDAINFQASNEYKIPVINSKYFFRNRSIYIRKHNRFAFYPLHTHQFFEINYVLRGHAVEHINGEKITLSEGDVLLLDIGSQHSIESLSKDDLLINILFRDRNISLDLLYQIQAAKSVFYDFLISNLVSDQQTSKYIIFRNLGHKHNEVQRTLDSLITEYYSNYDFCDTIIKSELTILIAQLIRNYNLPIQPTNPSQQLAINLLDDIRKHYAKLDLQMLADKYAYNKNYLSNLFHKETGKTFSATLTEERLIHAREAVRNTTLPITSICHNVGFTNKSFFYAKYSNKFGRTPKEDRLDRSNSITKIF